MTTLTHHVPKLGLVMLLLAWWGLQLCSVPAGANEESPLKPIDTFSPKATAKLGRTHLG
jgi:hypothetical protein